MRATRQQLLAELKRVTNFLEGVSIIEGPQAAAFTAQQLRVIARARATIAKAKGTA